MFFHLIRWTLGLPLLLAFNSRWTRDAGVEKSDNHRNLGVSPAQDGETVL